MADLNHAAARHRIAIRPNNRRNPSRCAVTGQICDDNSSMTPPGSPLKDAKAASLTRSVSLSSLDFAQMHEECNLLKPKSHSFKTLPSSLLMIDDNVKLSPNVIMVRTLPAIVKMPDKEQQDKFQLSIANWCLANEGLRKSIQSLKPPPQGFSLCLSSESLASICSGIFFIAHCFHLFLFDCVDC